MVTVTDLPTEPSDILSLHAIPVENQRICDNCNVAIWITKGDNIVYGTIGDHTFMAGTVYCSDECRDIMKESYNG